MSEKISHKEMIILVYSNLIEEIINSLIKNKETIKASNMGPEEQIDLRKKTKELAKKIAEEFADKVIAEGYPSKPIHPIRERNILEEILNKYREKFENESPSN